MTTESGLRDRLLALYRRFLGEPEREREVYAGFALFFGGLALGVLGLAGFLWSAAYTQYTTIFWQLRELAIVLAMLGLPAFVLSLVVLLPVDRRARLASGAGVLLAVLAAGVFVVAYPENWNVAGSARDYSAQVIAIYAAGLAVLAASTGAGLVAHRLQRAQVSTGGPRDRADGEAAGGNGSSSQAETVSEEQVRRDIEEAMDATELTWGGVERDDSKRLTVETDDADIDRGGFDADGANTARSEGDDIDAAVDGLRKLQGGELEEGTADAVDEQTAALQELRERQREEDAGESTLLDELRERFSR
jgi:hypothetical protein